MSKKDLLLQRKSEIGDKIVYKDFDITKADITDEEQHIIRVKFASFGNVDSAGDLLVKGCFSKSINERGPQSATNRKILYLWMHKSDEVIGRVINMWEEEDGAYADVALSDFDAVPLAKRAWSHLIRNEINQFSFGFQYIWDKVEYDEEKDAFIVREVKLFEISIVSLGCNEETEFIGVVTTEPKSEKERIKTKGNDEEIKATVAKMLGLAEPPEALTKTDAAVFDFVKTILLN